jgi:hypothetical protein
MGPRIFGIVAQNAPVVAVIRRGPSDWMHLSRWDLETPAYEPGAWLRGTIYPAAMRPVAGRPVVLVLRAEGLGRMGARADVHRDLEAAVVDGARRVGGRQHVDTGDAVRRGSRRVRRRRPRSGRPLLGARTLRPAAVARRLLRGRAPARVDRDAGHAPQGRGRRLGRAARRHDRDGEAASERQRLGPPHRPRDVRCDPRAARSPYGRPVRAPLPRPHATSRPRATGRMGSRRGGCWWPRTRAGCRSGTARTAR